MTQPTLYEKNTRTSHYASLTEKEIISFCQSGDLQAFDVLISRYEHRVLNLAYRYLKDYQQALDEAQEVFIKIYKSIHKFQGKSAFGTWLYSVTTNHCFTVLERKKRAALNKKVVPFDEERENDMSPSVRDRQEQTPEEAVSQQERDEMLLKAIYQLPSEQQQAIILFHFEGCSYEEIGEIMGMQASTVSTCLYRARQRLKKICAREADDRD